MTPQDEYAFLSSFSSAARRSDSLQALEKLWAAYDEDIARLSPEGQTELQRLRVARGRELMGTAQHGSR